MKPSFWLLGAVLLVVTVLKLPTLFFEHQGVDELVHLQLAENWIKTGCYSLQGTEILSVLPPHVYNRPLFHHPPLYSGLLAGFVLLGASRLGILLSWAGHLLAVTGVFLEWRRTKCERADQGADWPWMLALGGIAFDPLLIFVSRKLWSDSLLSGLLALAVALFLRFLSAPRKERNWLLGCGVLVGLGGLLKLHAVAVLVFFGVGIWFRGGANRVFDLVRLCLGPVLLVGPWLFWFHRVYGVWSPVWILQGGAENTAFMAAAHGGSPVLYWTRLLGLNPVLLVSGVWWCVRGVGSRVNEKQADGFDGARWMAGFGVFWVLLMTALGLLGATYEMRYIVPALPAWYAVVAGRMGNKVGYGMATVFSFLFAAMQGGIYFLSGLHDEFAGFWQLSNGR